MDTKRLKLREWKKVFLSDLKYINIEMFDSIERPAMILVNGEMGVGKTTYIKEFVGSEETMSPSYSVLNESPNILHADLYRLESSDELLHLELPMYLEEKQYFLVEWGKKYLNQLVRELPEDWSVYEIDITMNEPSKNSSAEPSRNFYLAQLELN